MSKADVRVGKCFNCKTTGRQVIMGAFVSRVCSKPECRNAYLGKLQKKYPRSITYDYAHTQSMSKPNAKRHVSNLTSSLIVYIRGQRDQTDYVEVIADFIDLIILVSKKFKVDNIVHMEKVFNTAFDVEYIPASEERKILESVVQRNKILAA